jgi:DNA-directed RNA polymerase subunit omega
MADRPDTMMEPQVEELLARCHSKFSLVTLAAKRAREINSYYGNLGESSGQIVPPQVTSTASKPLSIAFEEIAGDKVEGVVIDRAALAAAAEAADAGDDAGPAVDGDS